MATRVGVIGAGSVGSTLGRPLVASNRFAVKYGEGLPISQEHGSPTSVFMGAPFCGGTSGRYRGAIWAAWPLS